MKGKLVDIKDLIVGKEYWVEFTGEDWCIDGELWADNQVNTCVTVSRGLDLEDEEGFKIGINDVIGDLDFSITVYEWIEK